MTHEDAPFGRLMSHVANGKIAALKRIFKEHPGLDAWISQPLPLFEGPTLLGQACFYGQLETMKFLAERGADVNVFDGLGRSPLHWALTRSGDAPEETMREIALWILDQGADPHARSRSGVTRVSALEHARRDAPHLQRTSWIRSVVRKREAAAANAA